MSIEVKDIMIDKVVTIAADIMVRDAVKLMNKHDIGCLVVIEKGKPIGIRDKRPRASNEYLPSWLPEEHFEVHAQRHGNR